MYTFTQAQLDELQGLYDGTSGGKRPVFPSFSASSAAVTSAMVAPVISAPAARAGTLLGRVLKIMSGVPHVNMGRWV
jgi:hypothetical protein